MKVGKKFGKAFGQRQQRSTAGTPADDRAAKRIAPLLALMANGRHRADRLMRHLAAFVDLHRQIG